MVRLLTYSPCRALFTAEEQGVGDAILLDNVNEDSFSQNLKTRFEAGLIYTYIGEVVVSVNPYRQLDIFTDQHVKDYRGREVLQPPC